MSEPTSWHRLFGLSLVDFFRGMPVSVELEKDLSLQQQLLDGVLIRKEAGPTPCCTCSAPGPTCYGTGPSTTNYGRRRRVHCCCNCSRGIAWRLRSCRTRWNN